MLRGVFDPQWLLKNTQRSKFPSLNFSIRSRVHSASMIKEQFFDATPATEPTRPKRREMHNGHAPQSCCATVGVGPPPKQSLPIPPKCFGVGRGPVVWPGTRPPPSAQDLPRGASGGAKRHSTPPPPGAPRSLWTPGNKIWSLNVILKCNPK